MSVTKINDNPHFVEIAIFSQAKKPPSGGFFVWYGYSEGGFERRLLARPRWGLATAVAFPQKSESTAAMNAKPPLEGAN